MSLETELKPPYTREQCQTLATRIKSYFHGDGSISDADVFTAADMLDHLLAGTIDAAQPPTQLPELLRKLRISAKRDGELGRDSRRTDEIEQHALRLLTAQLRPSITQAPTPPNAPPAA